MNIRKVVTGIFCLAVCLTVGAQRYHCADDTVKAMSILREFSNPGSDPGKLCGVIAERLIGSPYAPIAQQDSLGVVEIRLDGFDDFAFVNSVAALAKIATSPGGMHLKDLEVMLEKLTFRRGEPNGFPTRMLYGGDWVVDNHSRGNVKDLTEDYSANFKTKSLEYVGRHPQEYAALKDSATLERQKMVEFGYRTFKIPHMKREMADSKGVLEDMHDGDLIMLLTNHPEKDILSMGYVIKRPDGFHIIHISDKDGKIVEEQETLGRYIKRNSKEIYGWRWLRII